MKNKILESLISSLKAEIKEEKEDISILLKITKDQISEVSNDIVSKGERLKKLEKCLLALSNKAHFTSPTKIVGPGTLVLTSLGEKYLYILPALGGRQFTLNGKKGLVITMTSDIANALKGKQKGEKTSYNNREVEILEVY